jgi:hypothetical protein
MVTREWLITVEADRAALRWHLVEEAGARAERGDLVALAAFAPQAITELNIQLDGRHWSRSPTVHDALDEIYDRMFPPPPPSDTTRGRREDHRYLDPGPAISAHEDRNPGVNVTSAARCR